ncbi:MAG: hypothetical protein ABSF41_06120 [Pseudolabrys sp.]
MASAGVDNEGVHRDARGQRPEAVGENFFGFRGRKILRHVERGIEITVADSRDDDIANTTMINARDLLLGNFSHFV